VIAQELLDALKKVQGQADLNPTAILVLSSYLQEFWNGELEKVVPTFGLGKALSSFFVDLSQHQLKSAILNKDRGMEASLLKFFGGSESNLFQFWKKCSELWSIALEPYPDYAGELNKYFDLLMQSSKPADQVPTTPASLMPSRQTSIETSSSIPLKPMVQMDGPEERVSTDHGSPLESSQMPVFPKGEQAPEVFPKSAYLVLQGTRIIPLNQPLINIGRRLDNHIILEDPRVSRTHAQIKLINDRFVIFDLHSTSGTFINGRRTDQSVLYPGDVISLAGVIFIYSQELPAKPGEVKIIELGSPFAADRPTAVVHKEELKSTDRSNESDLPELPKTGPLQK
jgi:hypothetical protein